jgi:hypothetical protein
MESTNESNLFELRIDHNGSDFLKEAAKWAKFLGIMGFIFCALFALIGLFAGSVMSAAFSSMGPAGAGFRGGGALVSIIYVGLAVLCFFPYLYLYNFAGKMQPGPAESFFQEPEVLPAFCRDTDDHRIVLYGTVYHHRYYRCGHHHAIKAGCYFTYFYFVE